VAELFVDTAFRSLLRWRRQQHSQRPEVRRLERSESVACSDIRGPCTLHPHLAVFRHQSRNPISLSPSPIAHPRPGIDTDIRLSRRSQGEHPLPLLSVAENVLSSRPRSLSLAFLTRLSHTFFPSQKGRKLHRGPRPPITNLPPLRCMLRPDCDQLAR